MEEPLAPLIPSFQQSQTAKREKIWKERLLHVHVELDVEGVERWLFGCLIRDLRDNSED